LSPRKRQTAPARRGPLLEPRWARVTRVQLIRREIREFLGQSALEVLFSAAEHVVEGSAELSADPSPARAPRVYATVMVTIDLRACSAYFREPADDATAERVAELMQGCERVAEHLAALARPKLAELAGRPAERLEVTLQHQVSAEGTRILIDGDAMARWDWPSSAP
jgi:hypothetical protein